MNDYPDLNLNRRPGLAALLSSLPGNRFLLAFMAIAAVVGALFLLGWIPRLENRRELNRMHATTTGAMPIVHTVLAESAAFDESGVLPGNIAAIQNANIYARVDGYLKRRLVDIGSVVKTGQLLAEIDTPTIDEELAQARADLAQARAQLIGAQSKLKEARAQLLAAEAQVEKSRADEEYASVTVKRWRNMASKGAVTLQSRDEKVRAYDAQTATLKAAQAQQQVAESAVGAAESQVEVAKALVVAKQASVGRFEAQQAFKRVVAPFDGVITARKVDPGALITAGSQTSSLELFQLAKIDVLRIYVNVPQTIAMFVHSGQVAQVTVPELPGRAFQGNITNVSGALDPNTRTRQIEARVENKDHALLPGMYAQVKITVQRKEPWIKVPSTALVPRAGGMYAAVVRVNKTSYQKVELGRDFGDLVEIKFGLQNNDEVIVSPPVDLREGEAVKTVRQGSE